MRIADILAELYRKDPDAIAMAHRRDLTDLCENYAARARAARLKVEDLDVEHLLDIAIPLVIDAHETVEFERQRSRAAASEMTAEDEPPLRVRRPRSDPSETGGPVVRQVLDLSTHHLPPRFFQPGNDLSFAWPTDAGMLLWVPDDPESSARCAGGQDDEAPEVLAVKLYARKLGCDYILFDRDAAICGALPTWEW